MRAKWADSAAAQAHGATLGGDTLAAFAAPSLMVAPWQELDFAKFADADAEREMALLHEVVYAVRNIRGEMKITPGVPASVMLVCPDAAARRVLKANGGFFHTLTNIRTLDIVEQAEPPAFAATGMAKGIVVFVELPEELRGQEMERLRKELARLTGERDRLGGKLSNEGFTSRAPADVVEKERAKLRQMEEEHAQIEGKLAKLTGA